MEPTSKNHIQKVKVSGEGRITIHYQKRNKNGKMDDHSVSSSDKAMPSFDKALNALVPHVLEWCSFPLEWADRVTVTGVSRSTSQNDEDLHGATATFRLEIPTCYAPLNVVTPHKFEEMPNPDSDPDPMQLLSEECLVALGNLYIEASAYVRGERAQLSLFDEATEEDSDAGA